MLQTNLNKNKTIVRNTMGFNHFYSKKQAFISKYI